MSKFKSLVLGTLIAASFHTAYAQGPWSIGAAVLVSPNPYKGDNKNVYPVPMLGYEGDNFYFRGLSAGYYVWNDETDKLSVTAFYSPLHFKPKDSGDDAMRALDKRKSTLMAGLSYAHYTQYGYLRTVLAGDTLGNSNGINWDAAWLYSYTTQDWTLTPGVGVIWSSENQNQYYYGISKKESARSKLKTYNPDDSWSPYVELSVSYRLNDSWKLYGMGRYVRLTDEVTNSPMVDKDWTGSLLAGFTYSF